MPIRAALVLVAALLLSAYAPAQKSPQSREEFKSYVANAPGSKAETISVGRDYTAVLAALEEKMTKCFNKTFRSRTAGAFGGTEGTTTYRTSINKLSGTKAELTVQLQFSPAGGAKAPPGGFYLLAADVSGATGGKTTVALYGAVSGPYSGTYKATKAWAEGGNPDCPKLVGS
jgi:hypothetical protein